MLLLIFLFPADALNGIKEDRQAAGDVEIATNPKTPKPKDGNKIRMVFEEELSIGVEEGDENYMFGGRVYFNADDEGFIYVTDWDRKRIQKFDHNGQYLLTIGRKGQGPGEFRNVWRPRFDKDNHLFVTDISNNRIHFFDRYGNFLRDKKIPQGFSCQYINSKDMIIGSYNKIIEEDKSGTKWFISFGMFDEKFNPVKEIHKRSSESKTTGTKSRAQFTADIWSQDAYKAEICHFMTEDDILYFGYPERYEIQIFSPEGKLTKIIRREYDPIRVSKMHKKRFEKYMEDEFFRLFPRFNDIKEDVFRLMEYPKYLPAYQSFVVMENGWLFVVVDFMPEQYTLVDIFDRDGNYIAQFDARIPAENLFFKNGKAYALATENDYRFVKRYKYEIQEYKDN